MGTAIYTLLILFFVACISLLILKRGKRERYNSKILDNSTDWINVGCGGVYYLPYSNLPLSTEIKYSYGNAKELMTMCYNVTMSNCPNIGTIPKPSIFDHITPVYTVIDGSKRLICCFFISERYNTVVACFSGTFYLDEWEDDLIYKQIKPVQLNNYTNGVLCHEGFYNLYLSVQKNLTLLSNSYKNLFITGHSLGGALASIAAFDFGDRELKPFIYTFAAPRSFNILGSNLFNKILPDAYRVFNTEDIIPQLPLANIYWFSWSTFSWEKTVYQHVGNDISFTVNLGSDEENHIESYNRYIPK